MGTFASGRPSEASVLVQYSDSAKLLKHCTSAMQ